MLKNKLFLTALTLVGLTVLLINNANARQLSIEELRIKKARTTMPEVFNTFTDNIANFDIAWKEANNYQDAKKITLNHAQQLWLDATKQLQSSSKLDDRPLYWARLSTTKRMRSTKPSFNLSPAQLTALLTLFEQGSRGRTDLEYTQITDKKILLTGFDPFLLDRNINQSNPSGIAALQLDGQVITYKGITAEINTVIVPVRYKDFDEGTIESLLAPFYTLNSVDMVVTVSMGRKEFDLEHFPGKRRSVTAPDNLNVLAGGSQNKPIIPMLHNKPLPGSEFVLFSLPVEQMKLAKGPYKIIDNHKVTSIKPAALKPSEIEPYSLSQLDGHIAVNGSGGGYLSNEISYRSIRLRDQLNSNIPTGHIHTPRIEQYEPDIEAEIVKQIRSMLEASLVSI